MKYCFTQPSGNHITTNSVRTSICFLSAFVHKVPSMRGSCISPNDILSTVGWFLQLHRVKSKEYNYVKLVLRNQLKSSSCIQSEGAYPLAILTFNGKISVHKPSLAHFTLPGTDAHRSLSEARRITIQFDPVYMFASKCFEQCLHVSLHYV